MKQNQLGARSGESGFSLIEVLIAALVASFAIAAAMQLFVDQNKHHIVQAGVADMQQNGRASVDELVQKIRQAGYRLPAGVSALMSWNADPDSIAVAFLSEPICTASLISGMGNPSSEIQCNSADCFVANIWAYIYDPFVDSGEFFYVTDVNSGSDRIQHSLAPLSKAYPAGARVFMLDFYKYYINKSDPAHPRLMVQKNGSSPSVFADNIEDLQFRYVMANGAVQDTVSVDRYVREVEVAVVARTARNDLFLNQHRYDTIRTTVMVRNLAMQ